MPIGEGRFVPESARASGSETEEAGRSREAEPKPAPKVPETELNIDFVRSSGPGGQKVNKTASKAQLRWRVGDSAAFTPEQQQKIRERAGKRLNADDEIVLWADTERSQPQNRAAVVKRLQALVDQALTPRKVRKATRVSRAQKQKRLDDKRRNSDKKSSRRPPKGDW
jgi:ribosome-associated protein